MTAEQAFVAAFLTRAVAAGLPPPAIKAAAERAAAEAEAAAAGPAKTAVLGPLVQAGKSLGDNLVGWGLPLALLGPPAAGAAVGHLLGTVRNQEDVPDPAEVVRQEQVAEYNRQADLLRRRRAAAAAAAAAAPRGRPVL